MWMLKFIIHVNVSYIHNKNESDQGNFNIRTFNLSANFHFTVFAIFCQQTYLQSTNLFVCFYIIALLQT